MDPYIRREQFEAAVLEVQKRAESLAHKVNLTTSLDGLKNYMDQPFAYQNRDLADLYRMQSIAAFMVELDDSVAGVTETPAPKPTQPAQKQAAPATPANTRAETKR